MNRQSPPRLRRPLAALWISLGVHAALIALVQVAPPPSLELGAPVPPAPPPEAADPELPAPASLPAESSAEPPSAAAPAAAPAPVAALTTAVDLTYYNVRDLDVQPRALREI